MSVLLKELADEAALEDLAEQAAAESFAKLCAEAGSGNVAELNRGDYAVECAACAEVCDCICTDEFLSLAANAIDGPDGAELNRVLLARWEQRHLSEKGAA